MGQQEPAQAMQLQPGTTWRRHLAALFLLELLAVVVWWLYAFQPFEGLSPTSFGDSYDYAQIARNIWRGAWRQGVTTYQIPPLALSVTDHLPFLDVIRAPLHPAVLALAFVLFGPWDRTIAVCTGALFLLSVPIVYLLGWRVFGATTALVATLVYALSDWVLQVSVSGLSEPLYVVLFVGMLLLIYESGQRPTSRLVPLLSGAVAGFAYLARYNTILFIPLIAIALFLADRRHRWLRPALFIIGWVVAASPWMIRNLIFFGQPLFSMQQWAMIMQTPTYPRFSLWKYVVHPSIPAFLLRHWPEMLAKVKDTLLAFYHTAPEDLSLTGGSPYTLILFLASLFQPLDRSRTAFRSLVCAMAVVQLLSLTVLHYIPRLLFPFYPLFLLFGLAFLVSLLEKWTSRRKATRKLSVVRPLVLAVAVVFLIVPTLEKLPVALRQGIWPRLLPVANLQKYGPAMAYLQAHTGDDAILISDAMDIVSWYGDRACIWTPVALEMVAQIEARAPVEGVYLTDRLFAWPEDEAWYEIYRTQPEAILDGRYRLEQVFDDGSLFYRRTR
jgi:4-amino-4-deoxy-L-arabinose transferase-like glycosyltransferase